MKKTSLLFLIIVALASYAVVPVLAHDEDSFRDRWEDDAVWLLKHGSYHDHIKANVAELFDNWGRFKEESGGTLPETPCSLGYSVTEMFAAWALLKIYEGYSREGLSEKLENFPDFWAYYMGMYDHVGALEVRRVCRSKGAEAHRREEEFVRDNSRHVVGALAGIFFSLVEMGRSLDVVYETDSFWERTREYKNVVDGLVHRVEGMGIDDLAYEIELPTGKW